MFGLEFDIELFGWGVAHLAEHGDPDPTEPCELCHGTGQSEVRFGPAVIGIAECPRGCPQSPR